MRVCVRARICRDADSCYSFWIGATLDIMGQGHLTEPAAIRTLNLSLNLNLNLNLNRCHP